MWRKTDSSDFKFCCREPIELWNLKRKLASMACSCSSCKKSKSATTEFMLNKKDQQVQAKESQKKLSHQCTQVNPQAITDGHNMFLNTITKDILCPSCFVTMSLLRGGMPRVQKDEEVETNRQMFCSEKCTERNVKVTNKSTSFLDNAHKYSNVTISELMSEVSSDVSEYPAFIQDKHQVKFMESEKYSQKQDPCLCLDKFINSIRPPLHDNLFE